MSAVHQKKYRDESWDFQGANTKVYTHGFHTYPAMMVPQVARKLLDQYGVEGGWLLDPYCGTGTSLVEASLFGMHSVGCDVNPLVRLIAIAKTTSLSLSTLDETLGRWNDHLFQMEFQREILPDVPVPDVFNLKYWFAEPVIKALASLRQWIKRIEDAVVQNFLWVAFSETVREVSYTRNGEFKLYRMPPEKLKTFTPAVFSIFSKKLSRNRLGLAEFLAKRRDVIVSVSAANTACGELPVVQSAGGYDLVLTSPPYGDSRTTVAYGQFSRLSAEWIGLPDARKIDRLAMGGDDSLVSAASLPRFILGNAPIAEALGAIRRVDPKRACEVAAFYIDLARSIRSVTRALAPRATVCYVVGNRRVKDVTLPTDAFVVSTFADYGFGHQVTVVRNILSKRMPKRNSPSNIGGKTAATMHEENIVICQRG